MLICYKKHFLMTIRSAFHSYIRTVLTSFENSISTDIKAIFEELLNCSTAALDEQPLVDYSDWQDTLLMPEPPPSGNRFAGAAPERQNDQDGRIEFNPGPGAGVQAEHQFHVAAERHPPAIP
jgi:hypothetical protein